MNSVFVFKIQPMKPSQTLTTSQFSRFRDVLLSTRDVKTTGLSGEAADVVPWEFIRRIYGTLNDQAIGVSSVHLEGSTAAHGKKLLPVSLSCSIIVYMNNQFADI